MADFDLLSDLNKETTQVSLLVKLEEVRVELAQKLEAEQRIKLSTEHLEVDGAVRVQIQDNQSELVGLKICEKIRDVVVAGNTTIDSNQVVLMPGHLAVPGNTICLREAGRFYQAVVLVVSVNTITLDTPLDFAFTTACTAFLSDDMMNKNGSVTPRIFRIAPPFGTKWDLYGCSFHILGNTGMDDSKFGDLPTLTRGIVLRKKDGTYKNIFNIKSNGDFAFRCDELFYNDKVGGGKYGIRVLKTFPIRHGTAIRLDSALNDELQVIIQDDLTGLFSMRVAAWGHVVT